MDTSCVVVGAGPVGLTAALAAARRGIDVIVVEGEAEGRQRPGSRAIFLANPTLRRIERAAPGVGRGVAEAGLQVRGYAAYYAGKRVFRLPFPVAKDPLRGVGSSVPQTVLERVALDQLTDLGVPIRWGDPVVNVHSDSEGVTLDLESGHSLWTRYVVAADGARSGVRKSLGITMEGPSDETPFIIVDVDDLPDGSTRESYGYFHYQCADLGGRNVMHMPFAGGMRIDLQCLPGDDAAYLGSAQGAREWIGSVVDPWYGDHIQWTSTYLFRQVVAKTYTDVHRRVLLTGEAAHLFAPFGGRGLNSGVFDATDAATAIARSLAEPKSATAHVDGFARTRRRWGLRNRDVSSRALRRMRGTDPTTRIARQVASRVAPVVWPAGTWLANGPTMLTLPPPGARGLY
ncbi:MAG: 3-(3-hydroxy-phenyl)propionate hydroxylase [Mycobacterium sp.]|nr:3-(3-hydroxy-phenyl)propionate hydroxylase [Mycobacterium sp.]